MAIRLVESNETGEEVATYVSSRSDDGNGRIDVIVSLLTVSLPDTSSLVREYSIDSRTEHRTITICCSKVARMESFQGWYQARLVPELTAHSVLS